MDVCCYVIGFKESELNALTNIVQQSRSRSVMVDGKGQCKVKS